MVASTTAVVHSFTARSADGTDLPLTTELELLKAVSDLTAAPDATKSMVFVQNPLPWLTALGELPAGFVSGRVVEKHELVWRCCELSRMSLEGAPGTDGQPVKAADSVAWASRMQEVLENVLEYGLWLHDPCFTKHTRPAILRGNHAFAAVPLVLAYCFRKRRLIQQRMRHFCKVSMFAALAALLGALEGRLCHHDFLHGAVPQLADLVLYSYMRVLLAVPVNVAPWDIPHEQRRHLEAHVSRVQHFLRSARLSSDGVGADWSLAKSETALVGLLREDHRIAEKDLEDASLARRMEVMSTWTGIRLRGRNFDPRNQSRARSTMTEAAASSGHTAGSSSADLPPQSEPQAETKQSQHSAPEEPADPVTVAKLVQRRRDRLYAVWCFGSFAALAAWQWRQSRARAAHR